MPRKLPFLCLGSILLLFLSFLLTDFIRFAHNFSIWVFWLRVLLLVCDLVLVFFVLKGLLGIGKGGFLRDLGVYVGIIFLFFLVLECGFMFVKQSSQNANAMCAQNWMRTYYGYNELGYRDLSMEGRGGDGKQKVFVLGDSFVAGHGIERVEDRVSNLLAEASPYPMEVFNLGEEGANVVGAYENLVSFPVKPDVLVWFHVDDDILGNDVWRDFPLPSKEFGGAVHWFIEHSFFVNYVFERFVAPSMLMHTMMTNVKFNSLLAYIQEELVEEHFRHIDRIVDFCDVHGVQLIAVVFPSLGESMAFTDVFNAPLMRYLEERKVEAIHVYDCVRGLSAEDRVVNGMDSHPSEVVNRVLAKEVGSRLWGRH